MRWSACLLLIAILLFGVDFGRGRFDGIGLLGVVLVFCALVRWFVEVAHEDGR